MRTLAQTIAYCRENQTHPSSTVKTGGLCLQFCREAWGAKVIGAVDANAAWAKTLPAMKHVSDHIQPPQGALLYFASLSHGHVAIADNDWYCYSTDINKKGTLARVHVGKILVNWGTAYRGWTSGYGSEKLPLF